MEKGDILWEGADYGNVAYSSGIGGYIMGGRGRLWECCI